MYLIGQTQISIITMKTITHEHQDYYKVNLCNMR